MLTALAVFVAMFVTTADDAVVAMQPFEPTLKGVDTPNDDMWRKYFECEKAVLAFEEQHPDKVGLSYCKIVKMPEASR